MQLQFELEKFINYLEALFPGLPVDKVKYGSQIKDEIQWNKIHIYIPPENGYLENSPYYFTGNRVVHFTRIENLNSILKNKSIWFSNLKTVNDPREIFFVADLFNLTEDEKEDAKNNIHLLSLCDHSILTTKEISHEFNIWRLYGEFGKGVAIVFSNLTNPFDWMNFHISKVIYGSKNRKGYRKLYKYLDRLNDKISIDFTKLSAFHKSRIYSIEREVRILLDNREIKVRLKDRKVFEPDNTLAFPKFNEENRLVLPIFHNALVIDEFNSSIPVLKIEKIILGFKHKRNEDLLKEIQDKAKSFLGYEPEVEFSRLIVPYYGRA